VRTWTETGGSNRIEAALVRKDGDHVLFVAEDGRVWRVPVNLLSAEDQGYLAGVD